MVSRVKSLRLDAPGALRARLGPSVALTSLGLAALVAAAMPAFDLGGDYPARVFVAFGMAAVLVAGLARRHLGRASFGAANFVTLVRAALTAALVGLIGEPHAAPLAWLAIAFAVTALILDGIDGRLARRNGSATAFGARFDMETDAAMILVLAALCWAFDKAGPWILATGLLRYAFVAAAGLVRFMHRPLPASRRRQTVCVVQIVALLLTLAPITAVPLSSAIGALGLALLAGSFAIDVAWLWRQG